MSTTIDTKVAQLKFDNAQFEKGVEQSIKDVDKLNKALKLDQASDGLNEVGKAIKKLDFNPIGDGITLVQQKFSMWEQIAIGAVRRIGDTIEQKLVSTLKELSGLNNLVEGYAKYDTILESENVLESALRKTDKGLSYIEGKVEELAWYSDETSYNLTHMTDALSKFVNAGVDIDDAVPAIQGIASWAAVSGVNAQRASSAFYNLSQAMGTGYLGGMDVKSLELLNMMTPEFKEMAIAAGIAAGKVKDLGTGIYEAGGEQFSVSENFKETLTKAKWLDVSVLNETLSNYGKYSLELQKYMEEFPDKYDSASEAIDDFDAHLEELGKTEEYALSKNAFLMAQQAKTFKDAIDATKDAASTKWYNIIKSIVGDLHEAKKLWTAVCEELYNIFVSPLDTLSDAFKIWHNVGGRTMFLDALKNFYQNIKSIFGAISKAFSNVFGGKSLATRLLDFSLVLKNISKILKPSEGTLKAITNVLTSVLGVVKLIFSYVKPLLGVAKSIISAIWTPLKNVVSIIFTVVDVLSYAVQKIIPNLINLVKDLFNRTGFISIFRTIGEGISNFIKSAKMLADTLGPQLKGFFGAFSSAFNGVTKKFREAGSLLKKTSQMASGGFDVFGKIAKKIDELRKRFGNGDLTGRIVQIGALLGEKLGNFIVKWWPKVEDVLEKLVMILYKVIQIATKVATQIIKYGWKAVKWIFEQIPKVIEFLKGPLGVLKDIFDWIIDHVSMGIDAIATFIEETNPLETLGENLKNAAGHVRDFFASFEIDKKFQGAIDKIKEFFSSLKKNDTETDALDETNEKLEEQSTLLDKLKGAWESFKQALKDAWDWIAEKAGQAWDWLNNATGGALTKLVEGIKGLFQKLGSGEITVWDVFLKVLAAKATFKGIIKLIEMIKNPRTITGTLKDAIKEIGKSISGIGTSISDLIKNIGKAAKTKIMAGVFKDIAKALLELAIALLIMAKIDTQKLQTLFPMVLSFMLGLGKVAKDFLKGTSALADATGGLSEAKALKSISKTFQNIAKAVIILVAALWMASKIDEDKAKSGLSTIMILMMALKSMVKTGQKGKFGDTGKQIKQISKAMLILVAAVFLFGSMDSDRLATGLIAVVVLLKMFEKFIKVYNETSKGSTKFDGVGSSFKQIAKALLIMVAAVFLFGSMPLDKLIAGGIAVAVLMGVMAKMYQMIQKSRMTEEGKSGGMQGKTFKSIAAGFVIISAAMLIIANAVLLMGILPVERIWAGAGALTMVMAAMLVVYRMIAKWRAKDNKKFGNIEAGTFNKIAAGFVILSSAMLIVANAILIMGILPVSHIWSAGGVIFVILAAMAGIYALVAKTQKNVGKQFSAKSFAAFAAGFIIIGVAMGAIAAAILAIGVLPIDKMIVAGTIIAACLGLMAVISNLMGGGGGIAKNNNVLSNNALIKTGGGMAKNILSIAAAIAIISAAMYGLGQLSFEQLGIAIGGLVAVVAAIAILSQLGSQINTLGNGMLKFFGSLAIGMIAVGAAVVLIALAVKIFNSSLVALAAGLMVFSMGGEKMVQGAKYLGDSLTVIIISILDALAVAIVHFCEIVVNGFVDICAIVLKGIKDLLITLNKELPGILEELSVTLAIILAWISDLLPGLLDWLAVTIYQILDWIIKELPTFLGYLAVIIPEIVIGIGETIISILEKLAIWIDENKTRIADAIWKFIASLFGLLWEILTGWARLPGVEDAIQSMFQMGHDIINSIWEGLKSVWSGLTGWLGNAIDTVKDFVGELWNAVTGANKIKDWDKLEDFFKDTRVQNKYSRDELAMYSEVLNFVGDDFDNDTQRAQAAAAWIRKNQNNYTDDQYSALMNIVQAYTSYVMEGGFLDEAGRHTYLKDAEIARRYDEQNAKTTYESMWDRLYAEQQAHNLPAQNYYDEINSELQKVVRANNESVNHGGYGSFGSDYGQVRLTQTGKNQVSISATNINKDIVITMDVKDLAEADDMIALMSARLQKQLAEERKAKGAYMGPTEARRQYGY